MAYLHENREEFTNAVNLASYHCPYLGRRYEL